MATFIRYGAPSALDTTIAGATLNNLASGSAVSGSDEDNTPATGNGDLEADFVLTVSYATGPPTAGTRVADLYILYAVDGTNFPGTSNNPEEEFVGSFVSRNGSTSAVEYIPLKAVPMRPLKWKARLKNVSGVNFKADNNSTLQVQLSQLQVVSS